MEKKEYITIGKILGSSGLDGWLKILNYSGIAGRFNDLEKVWAHTNAGLQGLRVEEVIEKRKGPVVKFRNINSKDSAERFIGCEILIEYDQRVELPEDTFFIHDLIGLEVYNNQSIIGKVVDVMTGTGNDIYVVNDEKGREILIPAIAQFGNKVDIDKKRIDVELIEGMLPEDEN